MSDWRYELALKQELEIAEEVVTGWILEELDLFKTSLAVGKGPERQEANLAPHQLTQLVTVAEESESVPAVVNYLRYQIARSEEGKGWQYANVGTRIVAELQGALRKEAENAAQQAVAQVRGESVAATKEEQRQAWIELTRRFLAALRRCFVRRVSDLAYHEKEAGAL